MKKTIAILLTLVCIVLCFSACGNKGKTLDDVKKAGELVIATSPDFPPFEELKENGKVEGIEIDILNLICDELGVELKIEQMDFESVLPGIQAGKYDVGVSGITVTEKRKKNVLFTDPYYLAAQAIVVNEGSDIKTKDDLKGKKISVQTGTTAESYCTEQKYDLSAFAANSDAQTALATKKVDAWVIDNCTAVQMVEKYNSENENKLVILEDTMTEEPYAFAFSFGSEDLVEEINKFIDEKINDGTIEKIFEDNDLMYESPKK